VKAKLRTERQTMPKNSGAKGDHGGGDRSADDDEGSRLDDETWGGSPPPPMKIITEYGR